MSEGDNVIRGRFPGDDASTSPALKKWSAAIDQYLAQQGPVGVVRQRDQPEPPWPPAENPMLAYLVERAREIGAEDPDAGLLWATVHAWFEGAVAERARTTRLMIDDV